MFQKTLFFWVVPLLILITVSAAVILMMLQIDSFRESYFTELKLEIRKSNRLTAEVCKTLLAENEQGKLAQFFEKNAGNPMILQIKVHHGPIIFESQNSSRRLQAMLENPQIRTLFQDPIREDVKIVYDNRFATWVAYHAIRFEAGEREYVLIMAELYNSVSRLIKLSEFSMIALIFLGFIIITGLTIYFFAQIRSPLNQLRISTGKIAEGDLDYPVYVPKSGVVREIALCVQNMATHLKGQILELRKLENCRGEFVTAISHAMKTPVTGILSAVEGIEHGALDDPEFRNECTRALTLQSQRLAGLLHDFLSLTALELQEIRPDRDFIPIQPGEFLQKTLDSFRNTNPDVKIELTVDEECTINADPNMLGQAFGNLLNNAVAHGGTDRITVSMTHEDKKVLIHLQDYGCGIDAQHLDKIFNRFYRAGGKKKHAVQGNGLGLAIVKHIIQFHGGTISVTSESGKGTTFHITLPEAENTEK